jgi:hypothetical protein
MVRKSKKNQNEIESQDRKDYKIVKWYFHECQFYLSVLN